MSKLNILNLDYCKSYSKSEKSKVILWFKINKLMGQILRDSPSFVRCARKTGFFIQTLYCHQLLLSQVKGLLKKLSDLTLNIPQKGTLIISPMVAGSGVFSGRN